MTTSSACMLFNVLFFLFAQTHGFTNYQSRLTSHFASATVRYSEPPPISDAEKNKLLYVLGLNMATQLPNDLKQLVSKEELEVTMTGVVDFMLERADDPIKQLQENGERLNDFIQGRAAIAFEASVAAGAQVLQEAQNEEGAEITKGGVVVKVTQKGVGMFPTSASTVVVHYTGMLADGQVFDSSIARGEPATFSLNQLIPGWQEGLQALQEGSKASLTIPSDLGYGPNGQPQAGIPGGAVLKFEVELIKVLSGGVGGLVL